MAILATKLDSLLLAALAGVSLVFLGIASHNYLHRKDNWRMFCFNLTGFNYREWRVQHAMSHHMYTNTIYDLEVTNFEPVLQWIPKDKGNLQKLVSVLISPLIWTLLAKVALLRR